MTRLTYSVPSRQDLAEIGLYIAKDNPRRAMSFVRELKVQCRKITDAPKGYLARSELGQNIRSCVYGNYVIFFCEEPDLVRILRILHASMDIEARFADKKISP